MITQMKTNEIRTLFLNYFRSAGHEVIASSSLVPQDDPSLLFTNAGMNQFKNVFLGYQAPPKGAKSAVSSQKCVRAGGKHNDLENVGYTARHHTFFEMLGNFSFGEYFKEKAILLAWNFLTKELSINKDRLYVTVYESDQQAYDIWKEKIGLPASRIIKIGDNKGAAYASDNFWQMGDTGPCGPCTEIFFDHGEHIPGGAIGTDDEGDRFVEIWNIVFMQYNRKSDGTMTPLERPCIDTGMGLERIAAVMQGVTNNYSTDLLQNIIVEVAKLLDVDNNNQASLKVIADHIRASVFLITDGVIPSNEGRGYVLRRIIRRALRHGYKLKETNGFFYKLVPVVIQQMQAAYPELNNHQQFISETIKQEEAKFNQALNKGMVLIDNYLAELSEKVIPGDFAFMLYDTYGFPLDLTEDIARENNFTVDLAGFESLLQQQKERARGASKFTSIEASELHNKPTNFIGYEFLHKNDTVVALLKDGVTTDKLETNDTGAILLANSPFYAESGGQVGDRGVIFNDDSQAKVIDTQKQGDAIIHLVKVTKGCFYNNDTVAAKVDTQNRASITCNHSATHLLHAALRQIVGTNIQQKGSLVNSQRLRFDFSHPKAVTAEQLTAVEQLINQEIRLNTKVTTQLMSYDQAVDAGAIALFGEKYTDKVRVITIGNSNFSMELCGGTHVNRTGDIGFFKIISESGIATGIRRIEAITGIEFENYQLKQQQVIDSLASQLKSATEDLPQKISLLMANAKDSEKQLTATKQKLLGYQASELIEKATAYQDINILFTKISNIDSKSIRTMIDILKQKLDNTVIALALVTDKGVSIAVGISKELTKKLHAGKLLNIIATELGGKGGGRPDFAQGAGVEAKNIDKAFTMARNWIEQNY